MVQGPFTTDRALWTSSRDDFKDFVYVAHKMEEYGFNGLQYPGNRIDIVADAFKAAGNGRKVALFHDSVLNGSLDMAVYNAAKTDDERIKVFAAAWIIQLKSMRKLLLKHPNIARVDGHPVIILYGGTRVPGITPELWAKAVRIIEAQTYRCIWLYCGSGFTWDVDELKSWLPAVDGVSQYGPWLEAWKSQALIAQTMKRDYPQKIFEAEAANGYYTEAYGGEGANNSRLTAELRDSWENAINLKPDAVTVVNWSDFVENTAIEPTYERWDSFLRICADKARKFRGQKRGSVSPDLIETHKTDTLVGEPLEFEVLGLPVKAVDKAVKLDIRLENSAGREVYAFPQQTMVCDDMKTEMFRVPSVDFALELAVYPVLRYTWNGKSFGPYRFRGSRLRFGEVPYEQVWSTPVDCLRPEFEVKISASIPGAKDDVKVDAGGVLVARPGAPYPVIVQRDFAKATAGRNVHSNLLLNGVDYAPIDYGAWETEHWGASQYVNRGSAAPLESLEVETTEYAFETVALNGKPYTTEQIIGRWNSRPVWLVSDEKWLEKVKVPVPVLRFDKKVYDDLYSRYSWWGITLPADEVVDVEVPKYRVPYWDYKFDYDRGEMCWDSSGYNHHGYLGGRTSWSDFGPFWYNYGNYFKGWKTRTELGSQPDSIAPVYRTDPDGTSYLYFDGVNDRVHLPPKTMFPYGETWEMVLRPERTGKPAVLVQPAGASKSRKMTIGLDDQGYLLVEAITSFQYDYPDMEAPTVTETIRSSVPVSTDKWTHIAVVNDCRHIALYIDGRQDGKQLVIKKPATIFKAQSMVKLGGRFAGSDHQWIADGGTDFYKGGIREVRVTGRPLTPDEFLK